MKITGHKIEKEFMKYIKITEEQTAMELMNHPYGRDGESTQGLSLDKIERIRNQVMLKDWSAEIIKDATIDDLDSTAIAKARELYANAHKDKAEEIASWDDTTFLNKAKITIRGKITNTALVLLGKEESEHLISPAVAKIKWILRGQDNIERDYMIATCPFLLAVDKIYDKIRNLKYRYINPEHKTLFPEKIDTYEPYVIREALNNAIAHQDYTLGGQINVVGYEDKLVFSNKGSFIPNIERVLINDAPEEKYRNQRLHPTKDNSRYGLYLSPLREERTPSFKVDYVQNLWYDFGLGVGGSIIDLVMQLERCDFTQAVRLLGSGERTPIAIPVPSSVSPTVPALRMLFDIPLRHPALVGYLSSRGIEPAIASSYCRQVYYTVGKCEYFAVGFRNDAGGWELRSERFKGSASPKHITTINNLSDTVVAFEGFMDFFSYLSMKQTTQLSIDAVVLNSVVNLPKAVPFLQRHSTIHAYFDTDEAGRKTTAELKRLCPNRTL